MPYVYFSKVKKLLLVLLMKRISLKPLKTCPRSRWAGHILHMKPCFSMMVVSLPRGCGFRSVRGNWSTPVWWSKILGPSHDDSTGCYHMMIAQVAIIMWLGFLAWTAESWSALKLLPHDLKAFMISGCHVRLTLMNPRCFISHHLDV